MNWILGLLDSLLGSGRFFNGWGDPGICGKFIFDAGGIGGVVSSITQANIDKILWIEQVIKCLRLK